MVIYKHITPGQGQNNTWSQCLFSDHKNSFHLPINCKFCPTIDILTNRKIGQGHPRVMNYINFVELHSLMLHVMFQNHRVFGSEEEDFLKVYVIYSHGGHLGHVN